MDLLLQDLELINGYRTTDPAGAGRAPDTTSEAYAADQELNNRRVAEVFLRPIATRLQSQVVLDVGCGVGTSVMTLADAGFDAYGVDLAPLVPHWERVGCSPDRFFVVGADQLRLPFKDETIDFAYSLGALEHVGTRDGHTDRRPDYHERRRQWVHEVYRTLKPGGHLLLGGPNRGFPIDFSHELDTSASALERRLSRAAKVSVHRPWGEYFLCNYNDVDHYIDGLDANVTPLRIDELLQYGRVPGPVRPLAKAYVDHLPRRLLGTGFNPWVLALVKKSGAA